MLSDYDPNYVSQKDQFVVGVKAIILNGENKLLLLLRSGKTSLGGKWGLPGGAMEHGEDVLGALEREIEEETGLKVEEPKLFDAKTRPYNSENILILFFTCRLKGGEVKLNWEHDDFVWVSKEESKKYETTPDARFFIENF